VKSGDNSVFIDGKREEVREDENVEVWHWLYQLEKGKYESAGSLS
jgi:hypothetical protein